MCQPEHIFFVLARPLRYRARLACMYVYVCVCAHECELHACWDSEVPLNSAASTSGSVMQSLDQEVAVDATQTRTAILHDNGSTL
jgi:hypothetical protein